MHFKLESNTVRALHLYSIYTHTYKTKVAYAILVSKKYYKTYAEGYTVCFLT